ncbi:MAG: hypothetical protein EOP04_14940 [Proteobacteria bacterium]|nr:MAG: hypothetical protein EOP04_14940 [Pseudomonadota bacterium]
MPEKYIEDHLAHFEGGASRFTTKERLLKYGPSREDGTTFVVPNATANDILFRTGGDKRKLEKILGLKEYELENSQLVRIDISDPSAFNARIPSGREAGANSEWLPGGRLPDGDREAVIDIGGIPDGRWVVSDIFL